MKNLFKLWKKGIAFEMSMLLIGIILGVFGTELLSKTDLLFSLSNGLLTLSIVVMIVGFVAIPIIKGFIIEWLNNKTDVVNKFINK